jgi:hypothetical protein
MGEGVLGGGFSFLVIVEESDSVLYHSPYIFLDVDLFLFQFQAFEGFG